MRFKDLMLIALLTPLVSSQRATFVEYLNSLRGNGWDVDESSVKVCYSVGGTYQPVDANKLENGFTCDATMPLWTSDVVQAKEYCVGQFPYHILEASPAGDKTHCKFIVTTVCEDGYYQIYNVCYKVEVDELKRVPYDEVDKFCKTYHSGKPDVQIAEYYSPKLEIDMKHMSFPHAWVKVPDLSAYFENIPDTDGALFVLNSADRYEMKAGQLVVVDRKEKHYPMCQYTPPTSPAQMNLLAEQYREIYPITITPKGAAMSSSNYYTSSQTEQINACNGIASIIGVESYLLAGDENTRLTVRELLTSHRMQRTGDYNVTFHESSIVTAMHGTRAPVLCSLSSYTFTSGPCDDDTWIRYERSTGRVFCHKHFGTVLTKRDDALAKCRQLGAKLTGFESMEEINYALSKIDISKMTDYHNWIGALPKCEVAGCDPNKHKVHWEEGVSNNLDLLMSLVDFGDATVAHICHYNKFMSFHIHPPQDYPESYYWCGKWANKNAVLA